MALARKAVQLLAALGWNCAFLLGQPSLTGLYQGPAKTVCCPGLNCYACPYAAVSCPLGALQNFIAFGSYHFSLYLGGFLLAVGGLLGRMVCGWLCPFGLFQELLHRIPSPSFPFPRRLRHLRWPATAVLIVLVPLILEKPGYCAWLCPAGALEGGVPLFLFDSRVRDLAGVVFGLKLVILAAFSLASVFWYRPFCRTACPLGLYYGFFNRTALVGLRLEREKCTGCGACAVVCPMDLQPHRGGIDSGSCVRCMRCVGRCPAGAISLGGPRRPGAALER